MPQDGPGLTIDGDYTDNGGAAENGSDTLVCGLLVDGGIIECAEAQPEEFIERNWVETFDFDRRLFANYGKDWWLGVLYSPARSGLMGSVARRNMTEAGTYLAEVLNSIWPHRRAIFKMLKLMVRMGVGSEDFERRMETCVAENYPDYLDDFQRLDQQAEQRLRDAAGGMARRMAGGVFVNYVTTGGRYGRRMVAGSSARVRNVYRLRIPANLILATWGGLLRTYMEYRYPATVRTAYAVSGAMPREPNILNLFGGILLGDGAPLDFVNQQDFHQLIAVAGECIADDEEDQAAFDALLDALITFHRDRP